MSISSNGLDIQTIIDAIPNPIFVRDRSHRIVLLNASACAFFGHSRETLLSVPDSELFPAEEVEVFHTADDRTFETGIEIETEEEITGAGGRIRHVITRKQLAYLGDTEYLVASVTDISATRDAEARNRYMAFHDTLTGLPNRALLKERIEQALLRRHHGCALLYVDLDRFKEVNDLHGHAAGDELIQEFSRRLSGIVRAGDTVARLGGDEFAILLSDTSQDPNADEVCRRVLIAAARAFELTGAQVMVGASIGVVLTGREEIKNRELQRRADVAPTRPRARAAVASVFSPRPWTTASTIARCCKRTCATRLREEPSSKSTISRSSEFPQEKSKALKRSCDGSTQRAGSSCPTNLFLPPRRVG